MHIQRQLALVLCVVARAVASEAEDSGKSAIVQSSVPDPKDMHYGRIFVKFDSECLEHAHVDLASHFRVALARLKEKVNQQEQTKDMAFNSVLESVSLRSPIAAPMDLPDGDTFAEMLNSNLADAKRITRASTMTYLSNPYPAFNESFASSPRKLGTMPRSDRENEIISALHLLAASSLVGRERVPRLLDHETKGRIHEALEMVKEFAPIKISEADLEKVAVKAKRNKKTQQENALRYIRTMRKENQPFHESEALAHSEATSIITNTLKLTHIDICIIENPFLHAFLLLLAETLPCMELKPEPDRVKDPLNVVPLSKLSIKSRRLWEAARSSSELVESGGVGSVGELTMGSNTTHENPALHRKLAGSSNTDYVFIQPNDVGFEHQWYLRGEAQDEAFGSEIIDGWTAVLRDRYAADKSKSRRRKLGNKEVITLDFADLKQAKLGLAIAVFDSGCSRNPDLVAQFWRNPKDPTCKAGVYVGQQTKDPSSGGAMGDCVGYDFGNDKPDPTHEDSQHIHGSSTSGIIAAEGNNNLGIVGICPGCKIVCLNIFDEGRGKIAMSSVLRAIEYVLVNGIKLSNHSYGGFGESFMELAAHQKLEASGHLAVTSSGNNGCNIDHDALDPNACTTETGSYPGAYTPASYNLKSIIAVGATDKTGKRAWFSNYGKKSVDLFAPGQDITTLFGENKLATVKGTSFSCPVVTAIAGFVWSYRPTLTGPEVRDILMSAGRELSALEGLAVQNRIASLARALGTTDKARLAHARGNGAVTLSCAPLMLLYGILY